MEPEEFRKRLDQYAADRGIPTWDATEEEMGITPECIAWVSIIERVKAGEPFSEAEEAHIAECESCRSMRRKAAEPS